MKMMISLRTNDPAGDAEQSVTLLNVESSPIAVSKAYIGMVFLLKRDIEAFLREIISAPRLPGRLIALEMAVDVSDETEDEEFYHSEEISLELTCDMLKTMEITYSATAFLFAACSEACAMCLDSVTNRRDA